MYKVLLVDDEILVREAISAKIEWGHLGFELVGDCENGKAAIEFLKENPVDVVLTDICMPYLDGMGLSKYIYENMPQTRIIIFSGYSDFEYAKQAIQYKVAEYLLKPVTAKELTEVLTRIREKLDSERTEEERIDALQKAYRTYTKNWMILDTVCILKQHTLIYSFINQHLFIRCNQHDFGFRLIKTILWRPPFPILIFSDVFS